jgi:hypothetical protein
MNRNMSCILPESSPNGAFGTRSRLTVQHYQLPEPRSRRDTTTRWRPLLQDPSHHLSHVTVDYLTGININTLHGIAHPPRKFRRHVCTPMGAICKEQKSISVVIYRLLAQPRNIWVPHGIPLHS